MFRVLRGTQRSSAGRILVAFQRPVNLYACGVTSSVRASVVFLKMQEFAHRPVIEQTRLRAQLEAVVAVTIADIDPLSRIVLDASDGAAILVLRGPERALQLAQRALTATAAGLPLSAGINHGVVQGAEDGKGQDGMVGDGIAVAASVAEFASSGRLLTSRSFREALAESQPGLEAVLVAAGTFTDRGLRTHELFGTDRQAPQRRRRRYAALSALAVIALLGAGIAVRIAEEGQQRFIDRVAAKYRDTTAQGERYLRVLTEKLRF
jgi:class 3 adenylate cyclase